MLYMYVKKVHDNAHLVLYYGSNAQVGDIIQLGLHITSH
jgi:hypothetical protein